MKPLSVAIWHNLPSGGGKRALSQQVRGLHARGHRIKVWSPSTADHGFLDLSSSVEERVLPLAPSRRSPLDKVGRPSADWQRRAAAMAGVCSRAVAEMKAEGFAVLLAHPCQQVVVPPIAADWDGPALLYLQEPDRGLYEARGELRWVGLRPRSAWPVTRSAIATWRELARIGAAAAHERAEASRFDRILVNSLFSREAIVRCYGLDATVCYLGVDCDLFRPLSLPREDFVLGVGAAEPHKGIELALRAVAALPEGLPRRLEWVANKSSSEYVGHLRRLAADVRVDLRMHERVADDDLVRLLNRARVFVHAAVLEPFGYAPLEAMACGTPVAAVGEGGVREFIRHDVNGRLVGQRSASALAGELAAIMTSPDLAERLGQAGRCSALHDWTLQRSIDRLEMNLYDVAAARTSAN